MVGEKVGRRVSGVGRRRAGRREGRGRVKKVGGLWSVMVGREEGREGGKREEQGRIRKGRLVPICVVRGLCKKGETKSVWISTVPDRLFDARRKGKGKWKETSLCFDSFCHWEVDIEEGPCCGEDKRQKGHA